MDNEWWRWQGRLTGGNVIAIITEGWLKVTREGYMAACKKRGARRNVATYREFLKGFKETMPTSFK